MSEQLERPAIVVTSGVSHRTGEGFVVITWREESGQLTPEEARQHALGIIEAADAAEFDAAFMRAMQGAGAKIEDAAAMLRLVRNARGEPDTRSGRETT